jgi:hypothetical protein
MKTPVHRITLACLLLLGPPAALAETTFEIVADNCLKWGQGPDGAPKCIQPAPEVPKPPADADANRQVDAALVQWSRAWMFDRYLRGSSTVSERAFVKDVYLVRGQFAFNRMGQKFSIPFAARFKEIGGQYKFIYLCYMDNTSGMNDCVDPVDGIAQRQAEAEQSRQMLGAIAVMGIGAAILSGSGSGSSGNSSSSRRPTCTTQYSYGEPGNIGYEDNGYAGRGIPYQVCN